MARIGKENSKKRNIRKNLWVDLLIYAVVLAILIWGGFTLRDNYYLNHLELTAAYSGSIDDVIEAEALVVREESTFNAPVAGILRKAVDAGARVSGGSVIAYIDAENGRSYAITAPRSGIVQFAVDGLESSLNTRDYLNIDIEYLFSLLNREGLQDISMDMNIGKSFASGDVIGKIADNLVDYHLIVYTTHEHDIGSELQSLTLELPDGSRLSGRVEAQGRLENGQYYILKLSTTAETEMLSRLLSVSFTGSRVQGVVIPRSALVEQEDGSCKLFYRKKNMIAETEVEVLAQRDDVAVVSGVEAGTDVVAAPKYARVGAKAYK